MFVYFAIEILFLSDHLTNRQTNAKVAATAAAVPASFTNLKWFHLNGDAIYHPLIFCPLAVSPSPPSHFYIEKYVIYKSTAHNKCCICDRYKYKAVHKSNYSPQIYTFRARDEKKKKTKHKLKCTIRIRVQTDWEIWDRNQHSVLYYFIPFVDSRLRTMFNLIE